MSLLSTFVFNVNYSPPLIRAREAAKSSAALLSTSTDLMGDPSVCHSEIIWRALRTLGEMSVRANAGLDIGKL